MKKLITSLILMGSVFAYSSVNAGGYHRNHNDVERYLGYTAAIAVTAGATSYIISNNYGNSYNRGYNDRIRYENARREQENYDRDMRARYYNQYQPRRIYYTQYPVIQERIIYLKRPVYRIDRPIYEYYP